MSYASPTERAEFDEKIAVVRAAKETAIEEQDFEKAAGLRDEEKNLLGERLRLEKKWKSGDVKTTAVVDEGLPITESLLVLLWFERKVPEPSLLDGPLDLVIAQAGRAMGIATVGSVAGSLFGILCLALLTPALGEASRPCASRTAIST